MKTRIEVIDRGTVIFSRKRHHVYLGHPGENAQRFEELLDKYEGETAILCIEKEDEEPDP